MGVVDEFVWEECMQQRLDRRVRRDGIDQIGALQLHHFLVEQFFAGAKFYPAARAAPPAVPAGSIVPISQPEPLTQKHVDSLAVEIGELRLHRGVAAAVQHQPRVLAEQTRGIDPERYVAAEVGIAGKRRIGVAIDPSTLHTLLSLVIRLRPRSVRETRPKRGAIGFSTPRSVISPVTSRAGVTSKA